MITIGIIDIGIGNTHSLISALDRAGYTTRLVKTPKEMEDCQWLILPGVGAFPYAMSKIKSLGFQEPLIRWASCNKPLIGICLGMQLLYEMGLEMEPTQGLGLLRGTVSPLPTGLKIPHMGWNTLNHCQSTPLIQDVPEESAVYFVHSFYVTDDDVSTRISTTTYGPVIPAIVKKDNLIGFQFHPEKSGSAGARLLAQLKEVLK